MGWPLPRLIFIIAIVALLYHSVAARSFGKTARKAQSAQAVTSACRPDLQPIDFTNGVPSAVTSVFPQVQQAIQSFSEYSNGTVATIIYKNQTIWSWGRGNVNLSSNAVPTTDTNFRIGSITKVFTTILLYQAVQEGKIVSLDDEISAYAPDFKIINPFDDSRGITWRQVASQLSGLQREAPAIIGNYSETTEIVFGRLADMMLIRPPDTVPSYSNLGFALIGHVIAERLYQTDWFTLVNEKLLSRLQMTSTGWNFTESVMQNLARTYLPNSSTPTPPMYFGWADPCGQLYSTAADMSVFVSAFLQSYFGADDPLLLGSYAKEMLEPIWVNPDGVTFFGTPWEGEFQNAYYVPTKGGSVDTYLSTIAMVPELQLGFVLLSAGPFDTESVTTAVFNILIPAMQSALLPLQPPPTLPPSPSLFEGYFGVGSQPLVYVYLNSSIPSLMLQGSGSALILNYVGDANFQLEFPLWVPSPCQIEYLLAANYQYVYFQQSANTSSASSLTIPGLLPMLTMTRIK